MKALSVTSIWNVLRTLRFRLAAWNALVVLLTAAAVLGGVRQGVKYTLLHEMDEILLEDIEEIQLTLHEPRIVDFASIEDDLKRKAEGHERHGWFVELDNEKSQECWTTLASHQQLAGIDSIPFRTPTNIDNYRVVRMKVKDHSQFTEIRVGARLDFLRQAMAHIDYLVSWAFAVALLMAPLIGYFLARRAAVTIGSMIDTAARLRPDHLLERLQVQGTGDELDHMAITVNKLLDRIAAYLQQKRDFLANAAHELRTPLAAVRSSVEVALNGNPSTEEYQELLADVIEQGTALEMLVNQLLLLSETENADLVAQAHTCHLDQIVRRTLDMFEGVAETEQVSLTCDQLDKVEILGDRQHWRQVVSNLIDNAVKYTKVGGSVTVSLTHNRQTRHAMLRVKDTGIGIPQSDLPKIFDRFFRADRARTHNPRLGGSGLGLSICKAIVEAYGGTIQCSSEPNVGTTVTVNLQCACCASEGAKEPPPKRSEESSPPKQVAAQ